MEVKDGLVAIAGEVLGDAQKEAEATIAAAEKEAKATLAKAKEQADKDYQATVGAAQARAEAEKRKIASLAEVDARNLLLQKKEELVDAAFEKTLQNLKNFTETDQYHDYLIKLIEDSAKRVGTQKIVLHVNAKDKTRLSKDILNGLSEKLHAELAVAQEPVECIGGCKIQTADGKVTIDSTIDNRLQELKPTLRTQIAKILFEKEA